ncbi:MAG: threonine-phosphate decarboxylase [Alphaproteobacteria bacterium]|nr:threonine-phosphate decarboxylase [Alphaproteobacteria bacterium]
MGAPAIPRQPAHGGDLSGLRAAYAGKWIDLSTGINPFAWPVPELPTDAWTRLPGQDDMAALLQAAMKAYGAPADAGIVAVPGTQAAIQLLPRLFARPDGVVKIGILGPTYNEHAHVWRSMGHEVIEIDGVPGSLQGLDILLAVNPNNPDGRGLGLPLLRRWHEELSAHGGWLILDEAFADVAPELSFCSESGKPGLVILRSFGKFFGLAGLRLGFVLGPEMVTEAIRIAAGPWAVSGPALQIGCAALRDTEWQAGMREELRARARRFDQSMRDRDIHVLGGTSLFRLAKIADAAGFATALRGQGIHVRVFDYEPQWMRFGLPADEAEFWRRFDLVLGR